MNHLNAEIPPVHGRTEIVLPGTTTADVVGWATAVNGEALGPITLEIDGGLFMGIELTFFAGEQRIHSIALFADIPDENEIAIMRQEGHYV